MAQDNRLLPVSALDRSIDRPLADFAQAKGYGTAGLEPTTFRDYLFVVLKRKWLILSLVLVVTSLVTIQAFRAPSIYEGETTIRIEQKAPNVLQTKEIVIAGQNDPNFWGTQLKLLENPALARQVVLTLDLQHNPSFFGGQTQGGFFSSLRRIVAKPKKVNESPAVSPGLTVVGESEVTGGSLTPEQLAALEPYEDAIIGGEIVETVPTTNLVKIKFVHPDPELAQKIANTLAEVFVNNNLERSTEHSTKAEDLLAREIANLQTKIKHDQEAQFNYAKAKNLPLVNDTAGNLEAVRLATLSGQLLNAENERKELQAQYEAAKREKDPFSVPDVTTSGGVEKLRDRISALKERRDALLVIYTPEWPEVKKIDAQLQGLEAELQKRPAEIVTSGKQVTLSVAADPMAIEVAPRPAASSAGRLIMPAVQHSNPPGGEAELGQHQPCCPEQAEHRGQQHQAARLRHRLDQAEGDQLRRIPGRAAEVQAAISQDIEPGQIDRGQVFRWPFAMNAS